jgi:hypothetical protein
MASQDGILKLRGTVAGLVFMKNGSVRRKPGSNKAHFTTAPSMVRVRENANEFGAASTAGKLLRVALGGAIQGIKYRKLVPRLTREMSKAIKRDAIHGCGQRQVLKAHAAALLPGFELNEEAPLGSTLRVPYSVARAGAVIRVDIPSINPSRICWCRWARRTTSWWRQPRPLISRRAATTPPSRGPAWDYPAER